MRFKCSRCKREFSIHEIPYSIPFDCPYCGTHGNWTLWRIEE